MVKPVRTFNDENGGPRELYGKRKPSTLQTRGTTEVLGEAPGGRDHNMEPVPQSILFDLKKPRDFAVSLLQPRDTRISFPPSIDNKQPLSVVDDLKEKPAVCSSTPQDEGPLPPAWLNHPLEVASEPFRFSSSRPPESTNAAKAEDAKNCLPSMFEPSYLAHAPGRTIYCHSKLALEPATKRDTQEESSLESHEDRDEPLRMLYVANPDPEPDLVSGFFSKSAAYNTAQQWAAYWDDLRCGYLDHYVYSQKRVNRYAPWMPSSLNPARDGAPSKAWSVLASPFRNRFKDTSWTMQTPLWQLEGSKTRSSRLLCDNYDNDPGHCVPCKYEPLYKSVLSKPFKRYRAARGVHYSHNSCRACFGQLEPDDADTDYDEYSLRYDSRFDEDRIPPRPSVDADKLWTRPLIGAIDTDELEDDDKGGERTEGAPSGDLDRRGSENHSEPRVTSADDETDKRGTGVEGDDHPDSISESSQGDEDHDDDGNILPPPLLRLKRIRRHSLPEPFVAPSGYEAKPILDVHQEKAPTTVKRARCEEEGKSSNGEPRKQDTTFALNGDESTHTISAGRAHKRARRSSLPSSSASAGKISSKKPPKAHVIVDPRTYENVDIPLIDGAFHCPVEGCAHTASSPGDIGRHLESKKHATHTYMCLDGRCLQEFAREDSLKRHYSKSRVQHMTEHMRRLEEGYPCRVPVEEVESIRRTLKEGSD